MSQKPHINTPWFKSDGTPIGPADVLTTGSTYYTEISIAEGPWDSSQVVYDAALAGTFTVEASNFGPAELLVWATNLVAEALPGWSPMASPAAVVVAAGAAGNSMLNIGGVGHRRMRLKLVCTGTGVCHHRPHSKA